MNRKEFETTKDEQTVKLCVRTPLYEDTQEADHVYATTIAELIKSPKNPKPLLRSQLESFLRDNKIWSEDDENKVQKMNKEIDALLQKLRHGGLKLSEGREIAIKVIETRRDILETMNKRRLFDETTIEALAESRRNEFLLFACTINPETGDRYWESFEDFTAIKGSQMYFDVYKNFYALLGIDSDFEKRLPETQWLTKYRFVDKDLRFTDRKTGEYVNRAGQKVVEQDKEQNNLIDTIVEEQPFIDDETNEPIVQT